MHQQPEIHPHLRCTCIFLVPIPTFKQNRTTNNTLCFSTDRVKQHRVDILSIAVLQTQPTELTSDPSTETTATHCLGVQSLLPALVAWAALQEQTHTHTPHQPSQPVAAYYRILSIAGKTAEMTHMLFVPYLVLTAGRYVVQVFFGDVIHWPHGTPPPPLLFYFRSPDSTFLVHLPNPNRQLVLSRLYK